MSSQGLVKSLYDIGRDHLVLVGVAGAALVVLLLYSLLSKPASKDDGPPWLPETIPFVSNTVEMSFDPPAFFARAL